MSNSTANTYNFKTLKKEKLMENVFAQEPSLLSQKKWWKWKPLQG